MDPIHPIAPVAAPGITPVAPAPRVGAANPDGRHGAAPEGRSDQRRQRDRRDDSNASGDGVEPEGGQPDGRAAAARDRRADGDEGPDVRPRIDILA
jgi:hypothetical protein